MLTEKLQEHYNRGAYPMHMPGHKRNTRLLGGSLPYSLDVSEIYGFDDLHDMQGELLKISQFAAKLYGADRAYMLTCGATSGILAGVTASVSRGAMVLLARNCHRSVYNALSLQDCRTVYIMPNPDPQTGILGSVDPMSIEQSLQNNPETELVIITSPTYEGVISDVRSIADICHSHGVMLFVDSAHGAHFGLGPGMPESAVECGADITVLSLHKTLPALTQCALLLTRGSMADNSKIARRISVFQTSSPSYVLLASIDSCVKLPKEHRNRLFYELCENLNMFDNMISDLSNLRVEFRCAMPSVFFGYDRTKIVISTNGTEISGVSLMSALRTEHNVELEMSSANYAVALSGICDTTDGFANLGSALLELDRKVSRAAFTESVTAPPQVPSVMTITHAQSCTHEHTKLDRSAGKVSADFIMAYPPGIPIIVPGERISGEVAEYIRNLKISGVHIIPSTDSILTVV